MGSCLKLMFNLILGVVKQYEKQGCIVKKHCSKGVPAVVPSSVDPASSTGLRKNGFQMN